MPGIQRFVAGQMNPAPKRSDAPRQSVILFDLGGVLIENTGRDGLMSLLPYTLDTTEIWRRWLESPSVRQFEAGKISSDAFAAAFVEEWGLRVGPAEFIAAFASWPKGFFPGAQALLASLRSRHHVACLSNTNAIHWGRFPEFAELFDTCFASHEMGIVKPEAEAFEHVLASLGVDAASIYFFDDLQPNVEAARALGIKAFQVADFSAVAPILRAEKLYG